MFLACCAAFSLTKDSLDTFALGILKAKTTQQFQNIDLLPRNHLSGQKICDDSGNT